MRSFLYIAAGPDISCLGPDSCHGLCILDLCNLFSSPSEALLIQALILSNDCSADGIPISSSYPILFPYILTSTRSHVNQILHVFAKFSNELSFCDNLTNRVS